MKNISKSLALKRRFKDAFVHSPILLDINGLELTREDRRRLLHPLTGGVILFARNWHNKKQLSALCLEIKSLRAELLICVDHEGGRVQRFRTDGFTHLPPMLTLGEQWSAKGALANRNDGWSVLEATNRATAMGFVMASELRACGVDFSFAPVLDLDHGRSDVIFDRAFHRDPRVVSMLSKSFMEGMFQAGMANCAKHFPGHGFVQADSHTELPFDHRSLNEIMNDDVLPYKALSSTVMSIMPAHVIYPQVDSRQTGFSKVWLQQVLREQLGFAGAIISDDLSMQGARELDGKILSYAKAAAQALNAGCDLLLLCNQSVIKAGQTHSDILDVFLQELGESLLEGEWTLSEKSEYRRRALLGHGPAMTWSDLMRDPRYQNAIAHTLNASL
ncbi:MAG: beta-N-acetylhexosaminidase [Betaproteobacteria bacterium]